MKKPDKELGRAHAAPIKWRVCFEQDDGSTVSHVVIAQTWYTARRRGALFLRKLPSEVNAFPLNGAAAK